MLPIDLKGKVAIVTGASSGIGHATALTLAQAGATIIVASRRTDKNEQTLAEAKKCGGAGLAVTTDVAQESDVKRLIEKTISSFGRLDIAVNNAGIEEPIGPLTEKTVSTYDEVFSINVKGVFLSLKYQIPAMLRSGGGSIVNTSSIAGHLGMGGVPLYVASKHAVEGLSKAAALEYAKQGIRINTVAPAAIETPMYERFTSGSAGSREYLASLHPIGRVGTPQEVANAVLWLVSPQSSFVTGHSLLVDGGFTAQ